MGSQGTQINPDILFDREFIKECGISSQDMEPLSQPSQEAQCQPGPNPDSYGIEGNDENGMVEATKRVKSRNHKRRLSKTKVTIEIRSVSKKKKNSSQKKTDKKEKKERKHKKQKPRRTPMYELNPGQFEGKMKRRIARAKKSKEFHTNVKKAMEKLKAENLALRLQNEALQVIFGSGY